MKAFEISSAFRVAFALDPAFSGVTLIADQSGEKSVTRPLVAFECVATPMNSSGSALTYTLTAWVESNADRALPTDPDPAIAHAALADRVRAKLHGAGKAALKALLNSGGVFDFRGWSATVSDPTVAAVQFRTPIPLAGTVLVI